MSTPQTAGSEWLPLDGPPWAIRLPRSFRQGEWVPTTDERAIFLALVVSSTGSCLKRCFLVGNVKWCSHFSKVWWFLKKWNLRVTLRACMLSHFSHVWLFAAPWTVVLQAPLSMGFSRQEYWSGLSCPPLGDLPNPGIEPRSSYISYIGRKVLYHWCHLRSPELPYDTAILFLG